MLKHIVLPSVALALFSLCGCTGINTTLCERAAECGRGGDAEIEACVADLDAKEDTADAYDCGDYFDDYINCMDARGVCDRDKLTGCDFERDTYKNCVDAHEVGRARVDLRAAE